MTEAQHVDDPQEAARLLAEKIKGVRFATFTTVAEDGSLHGRPMATQQADFDGDLWFFSYADSHKVEDVRRNPQVNLGYNEPQKNLWVNVTGTAEVVDDRAKMQELWEAPLKAFFPDGVDDPNLTLLKVTPARAEYWDGPSSSIGRIVAFARTLASGGKTPPGKDVKLDLEG
ncbi:pyridoxamine 5'-phosphate oxidase family protein [Deinococcus budaensis]|uniref:General stress protein 26 n=1 Tax=Deinococcus budaensis TaxID=1665626 RepID=A0A7W8GDD5_9DEIO|nr:pyridoxamine 5'-phosphate oxidase family protein [Deinococcus budaensis]MBB5233288.1 general stress protein 26 [Deinococcus budaensis]